MKTAVYTAILLVSSALVAPIAFAEGDAERGEALAYTCLGCHGIDGYRNAYPSYRVPRLGGQKAAYLIAAINGYRDGTREHSTMHGQAASLSDEQVADIAAYLATRGTETVEAGGSDGEAFEKAATCVACHGENGISVSPAWPTLAGQHEDYIIEALNQYRNGVRKDPVMSQMAAPLSDEDVLVFARYYSRLKGLETTKPEKAD